MRALAILASAAAVVRAAPRLAPGTASASGTSPSSPSQTTGAASALQTIVTSVVSTVTVADQSLASRISVLSTRVSADEAAYPSHTAADQSQASQLSALSTKVKSDEAAFSSYTAAVPPSPSGVTPTWDIHDPSLIFNEEDWNLTHPPLWTYGNWSISNRDAIKNFPTGELSMYLEENFGYNIARCGVDGSVCGYDFGSVSLISELQARHPTDIDKAREVLFTLAAIDLLIGQMCTAVQGTRLAGLEMGLLNDDFAQTFYPQRDSTAVALCKAEDDANAVVYDVASMVVLTILPELIAPLAVTTTKWGDGGGGKTVTAEETTMSGALPAVQGLETAKEGVAAAQKVQDPLPPATWQQLTIGNLLGPGIKSSTRWLQFRGSEFNRDRMARHNKCGYAIVENRRFEDSAALGDNIAAVKGCWPTIVETSAR
ncbi:hypothetical protein LTR56_025554 [Elasticomyces elasticus]|nr:hypothetical protein LTR56_025554 [Elasticomyces elasticus]KAK3624117.1 hypothetical protein LTR22_024102 [Elasticomyces elasticus]KAK5744699.1 hypothetical protein LTS12_023378 [Elasticomyces elasticus]